jgi:RNA polymerase sigma-70 factor (ECF subfamily)
MNKREVIFLLRATALRDDREAFSLFFHHYYTKLVRFALLFDSNRSDAEDTVSEVMIRMFRRRKELFLLENFEPYLFRSVKNEALNKLRSEKAFLSFSQVVFTANVQDRMDPHEMLMGTELYGQINKLIEKLPPKRQQVYRLIKDDGMCYKDVAKLMEISERTVEVHLKIAMRELRSSILTYLEDCYSWA